MIEERNYTEEVTVVLKKYEIEHVLDIIMGYVGCAECDSIRDKLEKALGE